MEQQKIAIITGATSGIGQATARRLAKKQIPLIINGRREQRLNELVTELHGQSNIIVPYCGDVADKNLMKNLLQSAKAHNLVPNTAILCAGVSLPGSIITSDPEKWEPMIKTNYMGLLYQLRICADYFLEQVSQGEDNDTKDIVVIGSTVGREVTEMNSVYGSSKFAVHALVESLRRELCDRNIRVSLIEPAFVKSGFQDASGYDPKRVAEIEQTLGKYLVPDDVAKCIEFVLEQPAHVHIDDIRLRSTKQKL